MRYVIVTTEFLMNKGMVIPQEWRHSLDGLSVIVHEEKIRPILTEQDNISIYEYDSPVLNEILNSKEWSSPIEELV